MNVQPTERRRVVLRDLTLPAADAILAGRRRPDWSAGYPTEGDRDIARWLSSHRSEADSDPLYLPKQIVDTSTGLAIGGIGCHQPPDEHLTVEIGYGIAPEWRNQGITTEAVAMLLAELRAGGVRLVTARTRRDNPPSQAVLRHNGFVETGVDNEGLIVWQLRLA